MGTPGGLLLYRVVDYNTRPRGTIGEGPHAKHCRQGTNMKVT